MIHRRQLHNAACIFGLALTVNLSLADGALAANWIIPRATSSGACHVQLETSRPILGVPLPGSYPTQKAACLKAKDLNTDDSSDTSKCFAYTQGAVDGCKANGVPLPN